MADVVRFIDPHRHLISSSTAIFGNEPNLWANGGLDFAQVHHYTRIGDVPYLPDISNTVPELTAIRRSQSAVPVLFAELGVDPRGPSETLAADPDGVGLHDGLWAGVVSGGFGTAMPWWWDSVVHPDWTRYEPMYRAVSQFVRGVPFDRENFASVPVAVSATSATLRARALVGTNRFLVWVKDVGYQWTSPTITPVLDAEIALAVPPGSWCGRWVDTWTGAVVSSFAFRGPVNALDVPPFGRDLALRLRLC
jgi:hypothetical protein